MDFNSLKDQVSNLSLYDIKAGVRKVQNAVMNYTEMESKVREATNNEPWGASSTLMQEIANGTHSYQLLNETMPMIYKRFTEKTAEEWRQIYKALQLLEFLIKNGSERVIDDARSHVSLLKMLRQFHYIDQNGKDQGINVRNRAKELAELLGDSDKIRTERKKARANRNKFGGVEGGLGAGGLSAGSRYGGFGSEEGGYGGYSGGVYGDGGGFGGQDPEYSESSARRDRFEEYDENDDDDGSAPPRRRPGGGSRREVRRPDPPKPKPKEPEVDFLSFDDDVPPETPPKDATKNGYSNGAAAATLVGGALAGDDDDFDDFQSATPTTTASSTAAARKAPAAFPGIAAPTPVAPGVAAANLGALNKLSPAPPSSAGIASPPAGPNYNINMSAPPPLQANTTTPSSSAATQQQPKSTAYQAATPNYFGSIQNNGTAQASTAQSAAAAGARPSISARSGSLAMGSFTSNIGPSATNTNTSTTNAAKHAAAKSGDAFGNLWSTASSTAGIKNTSSAAGGANLASLQREKASQGIWGHGSATATPSAGVPAAGMAAGAPAASKAPPAPSAPASSGGALDDLLG